ncbi:ATP-binding protein [Streptomyces scabiei]|uniref:ATP-binding protein n=3 Tax=Streptomyces scabiei TaxID=1930 RepID=UPI001B311FDE|nr:MULTISPECIES: ATP-binding protein [Streptomyces]MBP5860836.1 ATP-binding protein [Streptomyces sp. LBUM 1484]MBP5928375.1 ATP-binding protein [Streptomyces sp. LBUM 1479]MBP5878753.1 ATP-binding protein [Streptomyces sp. LBUM 1477]MBP5886590.1 ATP-binding protein [Streptomyces sp. LBUM 1487]MBP5890715.1 ATP-binding protein [Streptomyces sp. LBUM 1481]
MDSDGTRDVRGTQANPVPRPAGPPEGPLTPPRPGHAPGVPPMPDGSSFLAWLRAPRPDAAPGVWRFGHESRPDEEPETVPARQLLGGALIAFLVGWLIWSLLWNGYLGGWWLVPLFAMIPDSWAPAHSYSAVVISYVWYTVVALAILVGVGRLGRWGEVWRRYGAPRLRQPQARQVVPPPQDDPARWNPLREAGAGEAAERLATEAAAGLMRDVDHARIMRAWQGVRSGRHSLATFTGAVLKDGAAACLHPSGERDLPARLARHDLVTGQVRLGGTVDDPRNPYAYRGAGVALGPDLLGTSLLAVGPAGSGKTGSVVWPVAESLCLHALAGRAAVVVVGAAGAGLGPADAYDVVVRIGNPESVYDLDLYGGTTDPDEAAAVLAEALVGDLADPHPGGDSRRSTTVLAQLLGPYRAVHGRFPSVPELRQLLDGSPGPLGELRRALQDAGQESLLRELDARERQLGHPGDVGGVLADRVALLDRPAFAAFFDTSGQSRPFSLRALDHPVRVRIDLPERGHADASRILARLVLAQFTASVAVREDRSLFACLVLDDATGVVTPEAVRGIQRLRSTNAGAVLTLRTLDDVPRPLRGPLLGATGCRMALSGLTPWDGQDFAEVWGKEWTEARDVTDRQIIADSPAGKAWHALRRMITGHAPTARAVTVRQVERERWSASELAHGVPPGHAVLSLTTVRGEHAPPLLVDLRG